MTDHARTASIRQLNDELRCRGLGGQLLVTRGVLETGEAAARRILEAVRGFDSFTHENDPYGEHDCACLSLGGLRVIWKIDYYDRDLAFASPDPSDPTLTRRVMTVMLADEY